MCVCVGFFLESQGEEGLVVRWASMCTGVGGGGLFSFHPGIDFCEDINIIFL